MLAEGAVLKGRCKNKAALQLLLEVGFSRDQDFDQTLWPVLLNP